MMLPAGPGDAALALFFAQRLVLPETVLVLALLRAALGRGPARLAALLAALLAAAVTLAVVAPPLGVAGAGWYRQAARALTWGGGLAVPLVPSAILLVSAFLPGARHRWIDALHGLVLAAILGLWVAARLP